jgi:hypothetical protein
MRIALPMSWMLLALGVAGCGKMPRWGLPLGTPMPGATALPPAAGPAETKAPTAEVKETATSKAATPKASATKRVTATVLAPTAVAATPTVTATARLPLPGLALPATAWRTLVKAPGLPDMSVATELGPNTHFAVATGNEGLNTLRADLRQPANAWVTGLPTDTLLVAVLLGWRRGEGHGVEIVDLSVEDGTVTIATRVSSPGEWRGGDELFPVHLVALDRAALPPGPVSFRFLDADAVGQADRAPAFDVDLGALDPAAGGVARQELLLIQAAAEEATATPVPGP